MIYDDDYRKFYSSYSIMMMVCYLSDGVLVLFELVRSVFLCVNVYDFALIHFLNFEMILNVNLSIIYSSKFMFFIELFNLTIYHVFSTT